MGFNMLYYTNVKLADMHYMYGAAQGKAAIAQKMYMERFPGRNLLGGQAFACFHLSSAQINRFVLRGVIRTLEDVAEFLL